MIKESLVLHFCSDLTPSAGGVGTSVCSLLSNLSRVNSSGIVVVTKKFVEIPGFECNVNLFILNSPFSFLSFLWILFRKFIFTNISAFHCHAPWSALTVFAILASPLFRAKVFITPHGMFDPWGLARKSLKKRVGVALYRTILNRFVSGYVVNSPLEYKSVQAIFPGFKTHVIGHGIAISHSFSESTVRARYGNNNYLFLSRIFPGKGLEELLESWAQCSLNTSTLAIAGSGEESYLNYFRDFVSSNNLSDSVMFLGFVEGHRKEAAFNHAKYFVLPSHSENFGMVVLEAMSMGVPCIVSDKTPWSNVAVDGLGYLVSNTAASISIALNDSSVVDYESYLQMSGLAFAYAKNYSWESIIPKYFELYESSFLS